MKRTFIALCASVAMVFAAANASAQVKQYNYDLSPFSSIDVSNEFDVTAETGEVYSALVTVDEPLKEYVNVSVKGGVLFIKLDEKNIPSETKKLFKGKGAVVPTYKVHVVTPTFCALNLADKAKFSLVGQFVTNENFVLTATDNATVTSFIVNAPSFTANLEKKSNITTNVTTTNLTVNANGSSNLNLTQEAKIAVYKLSGSANVVSHGSVESLDLVSKGSAKAILNGSANICNFTANGSYNINALNLANENTTVTLTGGGTLTTAATNALKVTLSGGANLIFNGNPQVEVGSIKSSSMTRYGAK